MVGAQRERAIRLLLALSKQTVASRLEVIIVDTRPDATELVAPEQLSVTILPGDSLSYGEARATAVRAARGEIVAFLEDHCYPRAGWAEAVIGAYRQRCAAVGYAITNADPGALASRIVHLASYGEWESPKGGAVSSLPGGNVSYRKDLLLDQGDALSSMLQADFNLHTWMLERGLTMVIEPRACVEHQSGESILDAFRSSFVYSRILAATRAKTGGWSLRTRVVVALKDLVGAPVARLIRLLRSMPPDVRQAMRVRRYLPGVVAIHCAAALGEMVGYLAGEGSSLPRLTYWEVDAPRSPRDRPGEPAQAKREARYP